jgi:hypothetical protein
MLFFSSLFFSTYKKAGRSFGKIVNRHRGSGEANRHVIKPQQLYTQPYNIFRFIGFSSLQKKRYLNIFSFCKALNKVVFFYQSFYQSIHLFNFFILNKRSFYPPLISIVNDQLTGLDLFKNLLDDEDSNYFHYNPFVTRFIDVSNSCFLKNLNNLPISSKILYSKAFYSYSRFLRKRGTYAWVKLPSGLIKTFDVFSTFFCYGYKEFSKEIPYITFAKLKINAGYNRRMGIRPSVRGVAINPVDHPHGGRTGESRPSVSPWAKLTKGKPTVFKKK